MSLLLSPFILTTLSSTNRLRLWIVRCKHIIHLISHTAGWLCAYLLSQYIRPVLFSSWVYFFQGDYETGLKVRTSRLFQSKNQHWTFITIIFKFPEFHILAQFLFAVGAIMPNASHVVFLFFFTFKVSMRDHVRPDNTLSPNSIAAASWCWEGPVITIICTDL